MAIEALNKRDARQLPFADECRTVRVLRALGSGGVERVECRLIEHEVRHRTFRLSREARFDIHIVRPEHDMGRRVAHLVRGRMLDYIELDDGYAIAKTSPPGVLCGRTLDETQLRARYGVTMVGVKRAHQEFRHVTPETVIERNDLIIVAGPQLKVERFSELP